MYLFLSFLNINLLLIPSIAKKCLWHILYSELTRTHFALVPNKFGQNELAKP